MHALCITAARGKLKEVSKRLMKEQAGPAEPEVQNEGGFATISYLDSPPVQMQAALRVAAVISDLKDLSQSSLQ